jgi:hypothetical protein
VHGGKARISKIGKLLTSTVPAIASRHESSGSSSAANKEEHAHVFDDELQFLYVIEPLLTNQLYYVSISNIVNIIVVAL